MRNVSRQIQFTIRNPNGVGTQGMIPAELYANQPREESISVAFPLSDVTGNDDPPNNDEDGNPYGSLLPGSALAHEIGEISSYDAPSLSVPASSSSSSAFFSKEYDFKEFARLEIWDGKRKSGKFWFRISELRSWHHYLRTTFNESTNQWENTGSSSDVN